MYEPIYGNHVGIVISDQDPEKRGRIQVFVPHLSNTLYSGWNDQLKDISFKTFETAQQGGITEAIAQKLYAVLPWAESSVPSFGGGTSAPVNPSAKAAIPNPQSAAVQAQQNPPTPVSSNVNQNNAIAPNVNLNQTATGDPNILAAHSKLASDRQSKFAQELQDPVVQNRLAATAIHEVGTNPISQQVMMETILNRAQFSNQSITSILDSNYGPGWGGQNKANVPISDSSFKAINNVMNGSNITGMATDNSSNAPGNTLAARNVAGGLSGYVWLNNTNGEIVTDQATIDALNGGSTSGQYELLYRANSGYQATTSGKNATAYADANGLQGSSLTSSGQSVMGFSLCRSMVGQFISAFLPNGGANGFYSQPAVGAKVWVFFYGGDIQKPVYFGVVPNGVNIAYQA